jgi:multidrug efflux system membrane fusion protein
MDERTLLQIRKAISEGKVTPPAEGDLSVMLGLQNEDGFPHKAIINFVNNQVNSTTGSITIRGVFPNPRLIPETAGAAATETKAATQTKATTETKVAPETKATPAAKASPPRAADRPRSVPRLFSPGMFVRVRLPIGQPHKALLVIDRAIQSDQGLKYVYVVDAQNKVQSRSIKTGPLQEDGLRVVEGEIKPDDWVVVGGIQQARPQMDVKPDPRPMPSLAGQSGAAPQAAGPAKPGPSAGRKPKD